MRFKKFIQETIASDVALYTPYNYSSQNTIQHRNYSEFPNFCHIEQWNWNKHDVINKKKEKKKNAKTIQK